MQNPFDMQIRQRVSETRSECTLHLSLKPEALMLRTRYRALVAHYHVVPEPVVFDLGRDMDLIHEVACTGVPARIAITCYGLRPDGLLELVFRNWGSPEDGLPS